MTVEIGEGTPPFPEDQTRRIHDEYKEVRARHRTGIELYFASDPVPADTPVYVFQHTMKTAGTAVRALIYANLAPRGRYVAFDAPKSAKHDDLSAWYEQLLERHFTRDEQSRLLWAVGHTAAYMAPRLSRPTRLFTVVRQPVDQVVSRHWFAGRLESQGPRTELIETLRQIFSSPVNVKRKRHEGYWNLQSQSLLGPFYDVMALRASRGPTNDSDLWLERLSGVADRSVLLLQDRLDEAMEWFAAEQQWHITTVPKVRVNAERPAVADLDPELRAAIAAYNWLDMELYQHALRSHESRQPAAPTGTSR